MTRRHRMLPQSLHVLPKGARLKRACGAIDGGFVRERDVQWLKKFLRDGGGVCLECRKTDVFERMTS